MSCILSTGFSLDCRSSKGGISKIYLAELSGIGTPAVSSGIATITMVGGKKFYAYEVPVGGGSATSVPSGDRAVGGRFFAQNVTMNLPKYDITKRNEMMALAAQTVAAIVLDENGEYWLFGTSRGLQIAEGGYATGTASADMSGYVITLTGEEKLDVLKIEASAIAALIA
jgi:hypothetical protein